MELCVSDIVASRNGRDTGKLFFVLNMECGYADIADGKARRIENPKRKKIKHLHFVTRSDSRTAEKIRNGEKVTNNELKRALAEYSKGQNGGVEVCKLG